LPKLPQISLRCLNNTQLSLELTQIAPNLSKGHKLVVKLLLTPVFKSKILVFKTADVHAVDDDGDSALHVACRRGHRDVARRLLSKGALASVNAINAGGWTPLWLAAAGGYCKVVETLVTKGADINKSGPRGASPLLAACQNGHGTVAELLVAKGADVNKATQGRDVPILHAGRMKSREAVKALAMRGASVPVRKPTENWSYEEYMKAVAFIKGSLTGSLEPNSTE
jgi:ankyrin repeat protein